MPYNSSQLTQNIIILLSLTLLGHPSHATDKGLERQQAGEPERIALVIGNGNYQSRPLKNPVNDAQDIAQALRQLGFSVIFKTNADQATMENAINHFGKKLDGGAVGLFYYSGHGVQSRPFPALNNSNIKQ